jgi:hypothetical protein
MKRTITALLGLTVLAGLLISPATAAKPKPVATTLYMHGNMPVGDMAEFANGVANGTHMMMDPTEPATGAPKSQSFSFILGNDECAGNDLFPSWEGRMSGKLASDVTLKANFVSAPTKVTARVWIDIPFGACTNATAGVSDFQPPVAEVVVDVPAGSNEVEIVLPGLKGKKVLGGMVVELHTNAAASQGRVLYDSPEFPTRVEFTCIPASGSSCTG